MNSRVKSIDGKRIFTKKNSIKANPSSKLGLKKSSFNKKIAKPVGSQVPSPPSFMKFLTGPVEVEEKQNKFNNLIPPPATSDSIRLAMLLPLSGPNSELGQKMLNASQLAVFDFADSRFELLIYDTKGEPKGAELSAQAAISDGAVLIIGPLLAKSVVAATVAARAANVPVLALSNDQSVAGQGVFVFGFLPKVQVERVITFAKTKGISRYAVLAPNNKYGQNIVKALKSSSKKLNATVSKIQFYNPYSNDFELAVKELANYEERRKALIKQRETLKNEEGELAKKALKRLEGMRTLGALPFEALLVADGGNRLKSIVALLSFYGIDADKIQLLGTGQWDEIGIGKEPALVGGWFAAPSPGSRVKFEKKYKKIFKKAPPRLATLAYDATALGASLAKKKGRGAFKMEFLTKESGFLGRDGLFRLLQDGTTDRGLAILEVGINKNKVISYAPKAFPATLD